MKNANHNTDKAYQAYLEPTKLNSLRLFCLLGMVLYFVFIIADMYSLSISLQESLLIRGSTVLMFLGVFSLSYRKNFIKYYAPIVSITFLLASFAILLMIYLAKPNDHASDVYFAGIMLVIMASLSWSYLNIIPTVFLLVSIITGYVATIGYSKDIPWQEVMITMLFFASTIVIGLTSQILRTRYIKEIFTLKEKLNDALKEKTVESKANAFIANHDALTGLPNRRIATAILEKSLINVKETKKSLAIFFVDLNGLKQINDLHDYSVADEVIKTLAKKLSLIVKDTDCIARLGGSDFLLGVVLDNEKVANLGVTLEQYKAVLLRPIKVGEKMFKVGINMGIASYPADGHEIEILIRKASERRHEDKHKNALQGESEDSLDSLLIALKA